MPAAYLVTPIAGFALGFALARANSCTVASTRRLIIDRRPDWLLGLFVLISWSGLTLFGLAVTAAHQVALPVQLAIGPPLMVGGIFLGIGATLNKGCFLGSVSQLGRGKVDYCFTLIGIFAALACAELWTEFAAPFNGPMSSQSGLRLAKNALPSALLFLPFVIYGIWNWVSKRRQAMLALIGVGISGGVIYAFNADWSYTSGLARAAHGQLDWNSWQLEAGALAMFGGAIISSSLRHKFELRKPTLKQGFNCFLGGFLMGIGATLIPGGNDGLMLWAIPGLTGYGPIAYAIMILTIAALISVEHRFKPA